MVSNCIILYITYLLISHSSYLNPRFLGALDSSLRELISFMFHSFGINFFGQDSELYRGLAILLFLLPASMIIYV